MLDLILALAVYSLLGCVAFVLIIPTMAEHDVRVRHDAGASFGRFLFQLLVWPSTLIKYTSRETKAEIAAAKHGRFPWAYAPDGSEYSEDEKARRLEAMLRKGQE